MKSVRESIRDGIAKSMRDNCNVVLLGEEVGQYQGAYKVSSGLLQEFGEERVIDTPITEHGFAGIGAGMAMSGLLPIVEFMTFNFAMQAIDQIVNSCAKLHYMSGGTITCPIVFRGPNGAASRVGAQHSQCYASWYAHVPGLKVVAPYFSYDFEALMQISVEDKNPVVFLENEILYNEEHVMPENYIPPKIGEARVVKKGTDITIVTFSIQVGRVLRASEILQSKYGISCEVIDLITLRPIDTATIIESVKKTNNLVTVEEGWPKCGIGAEISMIALEYAFDFLDSPPRRVASIDIPLPYAENLESATLPKEEEIIQNVLHALNKESTR
ncbi:pyruvate dehydrogenase complex E1 component subunit beta [Candidatus Fokinia crypta]|uniref:Pyruvate dehydrogenase E1 component subunit beta n=1 Tax=Candidatus Fokinia crypta TaxID=1920990 RepID=A0ABZ0UN64_9RICK|nr:pyruvate dehydrogenase complex E1 component subunit beta [Candidatus Fokinia cryptica]WPX97566.1 Pyruvate dehydrogenase E1 subunit beta [Candidatus Fokinia cryptica]